MSDEAKDFTQKYVNILKNDLYLSAAEVSQILEADIVLQQDLSDIYPQASGAS